MAVNIAIAVIGLAVFLLLLRRTYTVKRYCFPPGPPGLPFVGNMRDIPTDKAWIRYTDWSRRYKSDIIRLNVCGTNIIVINSLEMARDLFDERSSIYNDRPYTVMLNELLGLGWTSLFVPYGERFRDMRKVFHQDFNRESVKQYHEMQVTACQQLLRQLVSRPEHFMHDIRYMIGRVILRVTYGIDARDDNDPFIDLAERAIRAFSENAATGTNLVDAFPFLKYLPVWFPGADFLRRAKAAKHLTDATRDVPFEHVKKRMEDSHLPECAITHALESIPGTGKDPRYMESIVRCTLGSVYGAGSDTSVATLYSFMLAMVLHPEVQKKAQQEIDKVIGHDRLPGFEDRDSLPFVDAIMNESLRWHPVFHLNVPHRLMRDDIYKGYMIPKDSVVIANNWAILHNEAIYHEPSRFNPERYIKDGKLNLETSDPEAAFGFGRRKCPGRYLAKDSMWIVIASILACFDITKSTDADGNPITPEENYDLGVMSIPKPFTCTIRPRSVKHERLTAGAT